MKYTIKKETKPNLLTFGKYKAVAVHDKTIESQQILKETAQRMHLSEGTIHGVIMELAEVVNSHLHDGDRVRLHFLPASNDGTQELYDNITFEKE